MLTKRQNLLEVIKGGQPDRWVNQYEFMHLLFFVDPFSSNVTGQMGPGGEWHTQWGVLYRWPEGYPGGMPIHNADSIVLKDINDWKTVLKAPQVEFPEEAYKGLYDLAAQCDREDKFLTMAVFPGLFEITHHLMGMENALMTLVEEPDKVREMIEWYVDWEISYAKTIIDRVHPDALFHHDDWGSQISTFISPELFRKVYLEPYKRLYGWYKANGIELIVHHSDSYAATYVPMMIEMGIDIWQGCMTVNDIPNLVKTYGGQISFMGGVDNGIVDREGWTMDIIDQEVRKAVADGGKLYFIPCIVMGDPGSSYPGVYDAITQKIAELNETLF